ALPARSFPLCSVWSLPEDGAATAVTEYPEKWGASLFFRRYLQMGYVPISPGIERGAENALRQVDDEEHEQQPVDREVERRELLEMLAEREAQPFGEEQRERCADRWPEHHVHAARDHAEHHLQRDADPGNGFGVDVELVLRVEHPADRGHHGGNDRDEELRLGDVDPDRGRGVFFLADRLERE